MSLFVKICGINDPRAAEAAVASGADAVGFVFSPSPRQVTPEAARSISADIPQGVLRVAVFRSPTDSEIASALDEFTPDLVQADHHRLGGVTGIGLLPVYREGEPPPEGRRFLYEGPISGIGEMVDLGRATSLARLGEMVLAGGLHPGNVGEIVTAVRPHGVDVSSGVETSPGVKDPDLIRRFVAAARAAEERLVSA
jgi:phosphoribosylanthranilate isomerase